MTFVIISVFVFAIVVCCLLCYMRKQKNIITETFIIKSDEIKRNENDIIVLSEDHLFNKGLQVKDYMAIGDFVIKEENDNISMGSKNIDIDFNRNTIFKHPIISSTKDNHFKGDTYLQGQSHFKKGINVEAETNICFSDEYDENQCLNQYDFKNITEAHNYIDRANLTKSACISTKSLESDNTYAGMSLENDIMCIRKEGTIDTISKWIDYSNQYDVSDNIVYDASNVCTSKDIQMVDSYVYGDNVMDTEAQMKQFLSNDVCHREESSCDDVLNYHNVRSIVNNNNDVCRMNDAHTILSTSEFKCTKNEKCNTTTPIDIMESNDLLQESM